MLPFLSFVRQSFCFFVIRKIPLGFVAPAVQCCGNVISAFGGVKGGRGGGINCVYGRGGFGDGVNRLSCGYSFLKAREDFNILNKNKNSANFVCRAFCFSIYYKLFNISVLDISVKSMQNCI